MKILVIYNKDSFELFIGKIHDKNPENIIPINENEREYVEKIVKDVINKHEKIGKYEKIIYLPTIPITPYLDGHAFEEKDFYKKSAGEFANIYFIDTFDVKIHELFTKAKELGEYFIVYNSSVD